MVQFGLVCASGVFLALAATLILFPALAKLLLIKGNGRIPRIRVSFSFLSRLFLRSPRRIVLCAGLVMLCCLALSFRITYEKDLFKVFLARNMKSMEVSDKISRKFHANFSQPTLLSFDVADAERGLLIQRELDGILEGLMEKDKEISSFDSITYLMSPESVKTDNVAFFAETVKKWPELQKAFSDGLDIA